MDKKIHHISFLSLLLLAMLVNILGQTLHEGGHSLVFQIMGREPVWGFTKIVQIWDSPPKHPEKWVETSFEGAPGWLRMSSPQESQTEKVLSIAAGPLLGLFSAVLGLVMSNRSKKVVSKQVWLVYALAISLVAALYYLRAPMRMGGDEYDIALRLGIDKSLVEIPLALAYLACLAFGLRKLPTWKTRFIWLGALLLGTIITGIPMAMLDPLIISQVDAGNPLFQPVFGFSLPVFITILFAFVGVGVWARMQERDQ